MAVGHGLRGCIIRLLSLFRLFLRRPASLLMSSRIFAGQRVVGTMRTGLFPVTFGAQLIALVTGSTDSTADGSSFRGLVPIHFGLASFTTRLEVVGSIRRWIGVDD